MTRNTDVRVLEDWQRDGAVKGGIVSRENLKATGRLPREADSERCRGGTHMF